MPSEPWVDSERLAEHLGKSVFTVRRWAQSGIIPGRKVGGGWMFRVSEVDDSVNRQPADPWIQSPRSRGRRRIT
ncbi:helix-turn-helix domain-containing protein [Leifsonia sp. SIMBA_070]|uniref:helix-turn-helix domain-containing protein n=1 Tax=Leifsonia sp. SIMBA_070 TaxID=3085810 RepID=UPI00397A320D